MSPSSPTSSSVTPSLPPLSPLPQLNTSAIAADTAKDKVVSTRKSSAGFVPFSVGSTGGIGEDAAPSINPN